MINVYVDGYLLHQAVNGQAAIHYANTHANNTIKAHQAMTLGAALDKSSGPIHLTLGNKSFLFENVNNEPEKKNTNNIKAHIKKYWPDNVLARIIYLAFYGLGAWTMFDAFYRG